MPVAHVAGIGISFARCQVVTTQHKKQPAGGAPGHKDNGMTDTLSDYVTTRRAAELH